MNNKGQIMLFGLMMAITIVILGLALAPVVKDFTDNARAETTWDGNNGLNCSTSLVNITDSTTLSKWDKANCIVVDSFNWYFVGFIIFMGVAYLAAKVIIE